MVCRAKIAEWVKYAMGGFYLQEAWVLEEREGKAGRFRSEGDISGFVGRLQRRCARQNEAGVFDINRDVWFTYLLIARPLVWQSPGVFFSAAGNMDGSAEAGACKSARHIQGR